MSADKLAKPELAGVKVRKRKKDIKAKYEPEEFCEQLIEELKEAEGNLDTISKRLEASADSLDFKRYVEPLFDVLFTGGILDAGGLHEDDTELSPFSVLAAEENPAVIKKHVEVFQLLIRRYRYLQKGFEDSITKMLRLLNRFTRPEANKLAICFSYLFATQMAPMSLLTVLFQDYLVKDNHALDFVTVLFKTYLLESSGDQLASNLKRNGLDARLIEFFPPSKRSDEVLSRHFKTEGLNEVVVLYEKKNKSKLKNDFKDSTKRIISEEADISEVTTLIAQSKGIIFDFELVPVLWQSMMESIEWSRRTEQCEDQAVKCVKEWGKVMSLVVGSAKTQFALLLCLQAFCYDDLRLTKAFSKFVILFYKMDILSEAAVLYWYQKGAHPKGKAVFLQQLQPFIKWLQEAEEESDEEGTK